MARKSKKDEKQELLTFEKDGKTYFIDEELVPKNISFTIPCSTEEHTLHSLPANEAVHDLLIRFGLAKELEAGAEDGAGEKDPE